MEEKFLGKKVKATISWLNSNKTWGFAKNSSFETDFFIHQDNMIIPRKLEIGMTLLGKIGENSKGMLLYEIKVIE